MRRAPGHRPQWSAIYFLTLVSKQLGLKLELKKRQMQVLVIDHIEEKPTEN